MKTSIDSQVEMFDEFQANKKLEKNQKQGRLGMDFFKSIKVELSFDIILITSIVFILITITSFFLGIQKGKKIFLRKYLKIKETHVVEMDKNKAAQILLNQNVKNKAKQKGVSSNKPVKSKKGVSPVISKNFVGASKQIEKPAGENKPEIISDNTTKSEVERNQITYKYTIQVGASRNKDAALKEVSKIKEKGYDAFLSISKSSSGKRWYSICVGKFMKSKQASSLRNKLKDKENYKDCFLTRI